ncbi:hypothetical protein TMatcc_007768 [Talaromyces marneffei ATCC 18224]
MRCKDANHAHNGSRPPPAHYVEKKEAHRQVFSLDLHHIKADVSSMIHLRPVSSRFISGTLLKDKIKVG